MKSFEKQVEELNSASHRFRKAVSKRLINAANNIDLPIHYDELFVHSKGDDVIVLAPVVNTSEELGVEGRDILFLYAHIPGLVGWEDDFYVFRIYSNGDGGIDPYAVFTDVDGIHTKEALANEADPLAIVFGSTELSNSKKHPFVDSIAVRHGSLVVNLVLDSGNALMLKADLAA